MGKIPRKQRWDWEATVFEGVKKFKEANVVVATLIATVTFAAAFTLPAGYKSDANDHQERGTAILGRNAAFKTFVVTNTLAMFLSTSSVLIHFYLAGLKYRLRHRLLVLCGANFTVSAMGAMVVAFFTGSYAVLARPSLGLAISTLVTGLLFVFSVLLLEKDRDTKNNHGARNKSYCKACNESRSKKTLGHRFTFKLKSAN